MIKPSGTKNRLWLACVAGALLFSLWSGCQRALRVDQVTALAAWSADPPPPDPRSPTGYVHGQRRLIVPAHDNDSYLALAQVQAMFAQSTLRLRRIDFENAPWGRPVLSSSLHRWWLAGLAALDRSVTGIPAGIAVERAALYADPLLLALALVGTAWFVRRHFGPAAAAAIALGFVALFPFAGGFLPGAPGLRGLTSLLALWSVLPLLAARFDSAAGPPGLRCPVLAGVIGGLGIWHHAPHGVPIVAGVGLGALLSRLIHRRDPRAPDAAPDHWWAWSVAGALTVLGGYVLEYFPAHLGDWHLRSVHPVYGLAWLGLGALLAWSRRVPVSGGDTGRKSSLIQLALALAALASLPLALRWSGDAGFLAADLGSRRLTPVAGGVIAPDLPGWLARDGAGAMAWATLLPVLLLLPAFWLLRRPDPTGRWRAALPLVLSPLLLSLGFAGLRLEWWQTAGGLLLALIVVLAIALPTLATPALRAIWGSLTVALFAPGLWCLLPERVGTSDLKLTETETRSLVERDLAYWLAQRSGPGGATVIAPPETTATLCYHGGLRGIGTLAWENEPGMAAAVRILSATSPDEAQALIDQRSVTHLVIPSWDNSLDAYAGSGAGARAGTFLAALHDWAPPPWLRPVAYPLPDNPLFAGLSVIVFEMVEPQAEALALSRLAEYFAETGRLPLAAAAARELARFPADLGALAAQANVASSRQDLAEFGRLVGALPGLLDRRADRYLAWDRRVSLAAVLLQARQRELAAAQLRRCLTEMNEERLRSLSPASLARLLVVLRLLDLSIPDSKLRALALQLLPPAARTQF